MSTATTPRRTRAGAAAIAIIAALTLAACATDDEVRQACHDHGGVQAVSGSRFAKYTACRDGYYRTVR